MPPSLIILMFMGIVTISSCYLQTLLLSKNLFRKSPTHKSLSLVFYAKRRTKILPRNQDSNKGNADLKNDEEEDISTNTVNIPPPIFSNADKTVVFRSKQEISDESDIELEDSNKNSNSNIKPSIPTSASSPDSYSYNLMDDSTNMSFDSNSVTKSKSTSTPNFYNNDIEGFKYDTNTNTEVDGGIISKIKEVISGVLIADFFLILIFLVWFIAASVSKEFLANAFLLERFQDVFQPVVQPALGVLMIGSVLSGVVKDEKKAE